jgi:hypothetical protein
VEHEEREEGPEKAEHEIRRDADELEEQGDKMDEGTGALQEKIDETSEEFEAAQEGDMPGARPEEDD